MGATIIIGPSRHKITSHPDGANYDLMNQLRDGSAEEISKVLVEHSRQEIKLACQAMVSEDPHTLEKALAIGRQKNSPAHIRWAIDRIEWAPWASSELKKIARETAASLQK